MASLSIAKQSPHTYKWIFILLICILGAFAINHIYWQSRDSFAQQREGHTTAHMGEFTRERRSE